jgi:hypothetical protein
MYVCVCVCVCMPVCMCMHLYVCDLSPNMLSIQRTSLLPAVGLCVDKLAAKASVISGT